ncbi:hypothetical protein GF351_00155 [Candidatus Woesearchaeota archaeon]|nr:hypothetical protein [Candidatus Woesearchaeota archaeon]
MRKGTAIVLLLVLLSCIFLGARIYMWYTSPFKVQEISTDVIVQKGKEIGLNVDKDALHFGMYGPRSGSTRGINITNTMDRPVLVKISKDKSEISGWISSTHSEFVLESGAEEYVKFTCTIPAGTEEGTYNGSVYVEYYRTR